MDSTAVIEFTFHYVSIKSFITLFASPIFETFTFHYVSIKSATESSTLTATGVFTFHYVSIKSPEHVVP